MCFLEPETANLLIGDQVRVSQLLINLANNALKFTSEGEIIIIGKEIERNGNIVKIKFEIKDTGIGIPQISQQKLFKSFSQVDSSTTRRYGGTGLGLAICKSLVSLMEGDIGLKSKEGVGSNFWFTTNFPVQKNVDRKSHLNDLTKAKYYVYLEYQKEAEMLISYLNFYQCDCQQINFEEAKELGNSSEKDRIIILNNDQFLMIQ